MSETRTTITKSQAPLATTASTQPAGCSTRWFHLPGNDLQQRVINYAQSPFVGKIKTNYFEECRVRHSPGLCPDGIPVNGIVMTSSLGSEPMWVGKCCVSGLYENSICRSIFTTPFTAIAGYTTSGTTFWDYTGPALDLASVAPTGSPSIVTFKSTTVIPSGTAFADPFYVYWKSTDLSVFPSAYASSVASQMGFTFTVTPSPGATISNALPNSGIGRNGRDGEGGADSVSSAPRVTAAGIAGIAVGCALGAVALFTAILLTLRWRRRKRRALELEGKGQRNGQDKRIMMAYEADAYPSTPERFDDVKLAEIDSQRVPAELG